MSAEVLQTKKPQKNDVAKAVFWKFVERVGVNGIVFVISLVLARLLEPSDYGILALLNIFIQVSTTLIDGGFVSALIQKNGADSKDFSTIEPCMMHLKCEDLDFFPLIHIMVLHYV